MRSYPPEPTCFAPGTREKEQVMAERWAEGYQLFHPADARYEGDTTPLQWIKWREEERKAESQAFFEKIKAKKLLEKQGD